jgi:hypothetical protein
VLRSKAEYGHPGPGRLDDSTDRVELQRPVAALDAPLQLRDRHGQRGGLLVERQENVAHDALLLRNHKRVSKSLV